MSIPRFCGALGLSILLLAGPLAGLAGGDPIPSDFDDDGDVDLADFAEFQTCVLGSGVPQTDPACTGARLDADEDVDSDDFAVFQGCLGGPDTGVDYCNGTCTCMANDSANCGACGNVCPAGTTCVNGACAQTTCFFPFISCGGVCVDPTSDRNHCGGCGQQCANDEACISGSCVSGRGSQATFVSPGNPRNVVCPQPPCSPGYTLCGGACVDLMSDSFNCGTCGNQCASAETCSAGQCQGVCIGCECTPDHPYYPNC